MNDNEEYLREWKYIPQQAFRFFPEGEDVKVGVEEKQWRKIFESGEEYDGFELKQLAKLEQRLKEKDIKLDPWFNRANKLRFLQANKFKTSNAVQSMEETTKWRAKELPVTIDEPTNKMLNSGAFYFCGRDQQYRPIIVADIGKFTSDDVDIIPKTLVIIMDFMISNLLIEGQVENYILIMNLQEANFGLRNVILKILSFTSNAYRGRLFASYILSMPTIIRWGWEGIVSNFVSENTLKKIKITGEKIHEDMWTHISKNTIEQQYGGNMSNIKDSFWPPSEQLLTFVEKNKETESRLISREQYRKMYEEGKLIKRKILRSLVWKEEPAPVQEVVRPASVISPQRLKDKAGLNESAINIQEPDFKGKANLLIQMQTSFIKDYHTIKTFFQSPSFLRICGAMSLQ